MCKTLLTLPVADARIKRTDWSRVASGKRAASGVGPSQHTEGIKKSAPGKTFFELKPMIFGMIRGLLSYNAALDQELYMGYAVDKNPHSAEVRDEDYSDDYRRATTG